MLHEIYVASVKIKSHIVTVVILWHLQTMLAKYQLVVHYEFQS